MGKADFALSQISIQQEDGRIFHDVEFSTSPCEGCGVCCRHYRVSFYQGEVGMGGVPEHLVTPVTPFLVCMKGTEMGHGTCVSLGADGRCGIYENRPSPCREFPLFVDGKLNPECVRLRKLYGITS